MSFEENDKKLMDIFKAERGKKPPSHIMGNFEQDVMKKIHETKPFLGMGVVPAVCLSLAVVAVMAFFVLSRLQPAPTEVAQKPVSESPAAIPDSAPVNKARKATMPADAVKALESTEPVVEAQTQIPDQELTPAEEQMFESLSEDLLLLQMLEEDEGLIDDLELIEADIDILTQIAPPTFKV